MILDLTLLLLYIPTPPLFNVYSKRDPNPEVRMTPLCMQRSVFVGSHVGLVTEGLLEQRSVSQ